MNPKLINCKKRMKRNEIRYNNFLIKQLKRQAKNITEPTGETFDIVQRLLSQIRVFRIKQYKK